MKKHKQGRDGESKKTASSSKSQRVVKLQDFQQSPEEERPQAQIQYEEEEGEDEDRLKKIVVPKAVYRVALILLVLVLGLTVWLNWSNLTPDNILNWLRLQTVGTGEGDGFPVPITGSVLEEGNFLSENGMLLALSDTTLTQLNATGKEQMSLRHSLHTPVLRVNSGKYLLFDLNSTGYMVLSGKETAAQGKAEGDILAGAVASNGRFALGTKGSNSASVLEVYLANGEMQFRYRFSQDYITAVALAPGGGKGAVTTVRSEKGELVSSLYLFDFSQADPISIQEARGTLFLEAHWAEDGTIFALGDLGLLRGKAGEEFQQYSFENNQPITSRFSGSQLFVSLSPYRHGGASMVLAFRGMEEPLSIACPGRVNSISLSGGAVGVLMDKEVVLYDATTGMETARISGGKDARALALANERTAYILGVAELRFLGL